MREGTRYIVGFVADVTVSVVMSLLLLVAVMAVIAAGAALWFALFQ